LKQKHSVAILQFGGTKLMASMLLQQHNTGVPGLLVINAHQRVCEQFSNQCVHIGPLPRTV
jgi:hypothetical protein